jgi:hypothetical protein
MQCFQEFAIVVAGLATARLGRIEYLQHDTPDLLPSSSSAWPASLVPVMQ